MALRIYPDSLSRGDAPSPASSKPRIAYVVPGFCADESDWCIPVLRNFIREMAAHAEVTVYAPHYPYRRGTYRAFGATIHCFTDGRMARGLSRLRLWRSVWLQMAAEHRHRPFDLLHGFWANEPGFLATRFAARLGIPSIITIGGGELAAEKGAGYGSQLSLPNRYMVERSLRRADLITAGSGWLARKVPAEHRTKLLTIPLGVDTSLFRRAAPRGRRRLLVSQSMGKVKDYPTLLRAFAIVARQMPEVSLTVTGNSSAAEETPIRELAGELGIADRITYLGFVPHDRMAEIYAAHDLLLHSSLYESQGMVILEALATGMPVVSTHVGIAADLAGELVTTVAPRDHDGMAALIISALDDPSTPATAYEAGPRLVSRAFSVDTVGTRFRALYARRAKRIENAEV